MRSRGHRGADAVQQVPVARSRSPAARSAGAGHPAAALPEPSHPPPPPRTFVLSAEGVLEDLAAKDVTVDLPAGDDGRAAVFRMLLTPDKSGGSESAVGCACFAYVIAEKAYGLAPQDMRDAHGLPPYPCDGGETRASARSRRHVLDDAVRGLLAKDIVLTVTGDQVTIKTEKTGGDLQVLDGANPFMELGRYVATSLLDNIKRLKTDETA